MSDDVVEIVEDISDGTLEIVESSSVGTVEIVNTVLVEELTLEIVEDAGDDVLEIVEDSAADTVEVVNDTSVHEVVIESAGIIPGPRGADGLPGGSTLSYPAGEILSGHRMVVLNDGELFYADRTITVHAKKILGMTVGATTLGELAGVQTGGEITEPSWSWTLDVPVWLGVNGLLTQVIPTVGFSLIVGFPISSTKLLIRISEPLFLI